MPIQNGRDHDYVGAYIIRPVFGIWARAYVAKLSDIHLSALLVTSSEVLFAAATVATSMRELCGGYLWMSGKVFSVRPNTFVKERCVRALLPWNIKSGPCGNFKVDRRLENRCRERTRRIERFAAPSFKRKLYENWSVFEARNVITALLLPHAKSGCQREFFTKRSAVNSSTRNGAKKKRTYAHQKRFLSYMVNEEVNNV